MKIAISGKSGCGNTTVSKMTAAKLGLKFVNYTFRIMAREKGIAFEELCRLAETDKSYDIMLDKKQIELASEGNCVLGSRLAIWLIEDADLKVFLDAPTDVRAGRIHRREGGSYDEVLKKTILRDKKDSERYKNLYSIDNNDFSFADLVIDTSAWSAEEVAQLIVDKAESSKNGKK
ncbi:MAG: AAA family ATPase [Spirochaetia bacterium]|jgi:cytidylate kinase|nr:AAA family ATPase [Spirochaetia bacterium]